MNLENKQWDDYKANKKRHEEMQKKREKEQDKKLHSNVQAQDREDKFAVMKKRMDEMSAQLEANKKRMAEQHANGIMEVKRDTPVVKEENRDHEDFLEKFKVEIL